MGKLDSFINNRPIPYTIRLSEAESDRQYCGMIKQRTMPPPPYIRKVLGTHITANSIHVKNSAECSRRYGANKNNKMLHVTVIKVIHTTNSETTIVHTKL